MAKALVIKGANFALNKITTVTLDDIISCTGITLSDSTFVATAIGATKTLTATITPSDTTEQVVWASSDTNVATISNGVITIVGVGTANITATCGSHMATCTVTATVTLDISTMAYRNGFGYQSTDLANNKDYISTYIHVANRAYFDTSNPLNGYPVTSNSSSDYDDVYPLPLPANASHVVFQASSSQWVGRGIVLVNANEKHINNPANARADSCRAYTDIIYSTTSDTVETDIPADANGYSFYVRRVGANDASNVGNAIGTIIFS